MKKQYISTIQIPEPEDRISRNDQDKFKDSITIKGVVGKTFTGGNDMEEYVTRPCKTVLNRILQGPCLFILP